METMTVRYDPKISDPKKRMTCKPDTIHVPKFCEEDILLVMDDQTVDKYNFAADAIVFKNKGYAKRFKWFNLNKKTIWLHDDNSRYHKNEENAKFDLTITDSPGKKARLDPRVVND